MAALAAMSVADLVYPDLAEWWEKHPMTATGVAGLLLLAATVLLVEAVAQRLEDRRWRVPATVLTRDIMKNADWLTTAIDRDLAAIRKAGERPENLLAVPEPTSDHWRLRRTPFEVFAGDLHQGWDALRGWTTSGTAVLTATDEIHRIYEALVLINDKLGEVIERLGPFYVYLEMARNRQEAELAELDPEHRRYLEERASEAPSSPPLDDGYWSEQWTHIVSGCNAVVDAIERLRTLRLEVLDAREEEPSDTLPLDHSHIPRPS